VEHNFDIDDTGNVTLQIYSTLPAGYTTCGPVIDDVSITQSGQPYTNNNTIIWLTQPVTIVGGPFIQLPSGSCSVTISSSSPTAVIVVAGTAAISGTLNILIVNGSIPEGVIFSLNATNVTGSFQTINVTPPPGSTPCNKLVSHQMVGSQTLSITLSIDNSSCNGRSHIKLALIVGVSVGAVLLIVIVVIIAGILVRKYKGKKNNTITFRSGEYVHGVD